MITDLLKQIQLLSPVLNGDVEAIEELPEEEIEVENPECSEFKYVEFQYDKKQSV